MKVVGFTGTRRGMTPQQISACERFLNPLMVKEFHHGDCVGADYQAACIADEHAIATIAHPGNSFVMAGGHKSDIILPRLPMLVRNRLIVDICDWLLCMPGEMNEVLRSGTWMTIRYARKMHKSHIIVYPNGYLDQFGGDLPS